MRQYSGTVIVLASFAGCSGEISRLNSFYRIVSIPFSMRHSVGGIGVPLDSAGMLCEPKPRRSYSTLDDQWSGPSESPLL
jgi:hypothetical protein